MAKSLRPGDTVAVHLKEDRVVSPYSAYDRAEVFQVIATDYYGTYVYIPDHIFVAETHKIDEITADSLNIRSPFIGERMAYLENSQIAKVVSTLDGCLCTRCNEFFPQASPNQEDGTMLCFLCKTYPWR